MSARRALVVVDVQPTFCESGELPVPGGNETAAAIARYVGSAAMNYDVVVTSQDWHIDPGAHFSTEPDYDQSWPPHGLAGTAHADLHPALTHALSAVSTISVQKGQYSAAYSAFEGTDRDGRTLGELLAAAKVAEVDVCGIAESHCVRATALDAIGLGLRVTLLVDLTVPVTASAGEQARADIVAAGGHLRRSSEPRQG